MPKKTSQKQVIDDEDEVNTFHNYIHITFFKYIRWTLFILKIYTEQLHDNDSARHFPIYIYVIYFKKQFLFPRVHLVTHMLQNYILYIFFLLYHFSFNVVLFSMFFTKPTGPWSRPTSRSYHRNGWGKVKFFILSKNVFWKRLKRWIKKWPGILSFYLKRRH